MAQLYEYIKMAIDNIRANKGRSFLTMLGIIIGISSVIMIMSIGGGAKKEMSDTLNAIAGGQIYIYVNSDTGETAEYITPEDLTAIKDKVPNVKGVTPADSMGGTVLAPKGNFDLIASTGTADLEYTHNPEMLYGHYFTDSDVEAMNLVMVIGQKDAIRMFGTDDVVGMTVEATIYNITQEITICGVIKEEDSEGGMMDAMMYQSSYVTGYMPYTANFAFGYELDEFYSIYIISEGSEYSQAVGSESMKLLENRHQSQGQDAFMMQDGDSQIAQITSMLDMITAFIAFVAAIALLVGGIGVMNIMLVSVTERTREIGIRKALGARTGSIMMQFLAESAIITCIGGVIGIILGLAGAYAICATPMLGFPPDLNVMTILLATVFASAVGIFFGIYPAKKAARLSPIEALRRN